MNLLFSVALTFHSIVLTLSGPLGGTCCRYRLQERVPGDGAALRDQQWVPRAVPRYATRPGGPRLHSTGMGTQSDGRRAQSRLRKGTR